jgi:hypothetical protein
MHASCQQATLHVWPGIPQTPQVIGVLTFREGSQIWKNISLRFKVSRQLQAINIAVHEGFASCQGFSRSLDVLLPVFLQLR